MHITCLNCGHSFEGNFCPECGQKATVKKLTAAVLLEDTFHFFTHLEKGVLLFFTSWNFLIRPGISSINYVSGKRKKYQSPVSYLLIWTGLYFLLHNTIINYYHYQLTTEIITSMDIGEQANILFRRHFTVFIIPLMFISAFFLYYTLAKPLYNFIEVLTICLYGSGTYFMMLFISDLILGVIFKVNILSANVFIWQTIMSAVYNFWFSFDFFKRLHLRLFWLRLIMASILVTIGGWLIMFYLPMLWIYFKR